MHTRHNKFTREIELLKTLSTRLVEPSFHARTETVRNRVRAAIRDVPQCAPAQHTLSRPRSFFALPAFRYALSTGVGVLTVSGLVFAAQGTLPGDAIYPVKQLSERVELALTFSEPQKALVQTKHAEERLHELAEIEKDNSREPEIRTQAQAAADAQFENALLSLTEAREQLAEKQEATHLRLQEINTAREQLNVHAREELELEVEIEFDDTSTERKREELRKRFEEARKERDKKRQERRKESDEKQKERRGDESNASDERNRGREEDYEPEESERSSLPRQPEAVFDVLFTVLSSTQDTTHNNTTTSESWDDKNKEANEQRSDDKRHREDTNNGDE